MKTKDRLWWSFVIDNNKKEAFNNYLEKNNVVKLHCGT